MCGIAGLAGAGAADVAALERMASAMIHRGPDGEGVWHDDEVGLSFRRLAIIDLNERSNQPMHFGPFHLVFNGEIYNYLELRAELAKLGHVFVTEGDGEVLLHAWAQWHEDALARLNGMFAFGIWDSERQSLTLATDPFGEKPLLYVERPDRLLFASDVRALKAADASIGIVDEAATRAFLRLGVLPSYPQTFFADVRRLPPAHAARWQRGGRITVQRYWKPGPVSVPTSPHDAAVRLRELLFESVRLRLRSDVAIGTSLSGGVDSSGIATVMAQLVEDHDRHAFTASFPGFERDEWAHAAVAATAANVGIHHAVRPTANELIDDLERLVVDQEEPFGSTSIYAQWRVMRAAREAGVIVLLDGQGADELFGGYAGIAGPALRSIGSQAALKAVRSNPKLASEVAGTYLAGRRIPPAVARLRGLSNTSPYVSDEALVDSGGKTEPVDDWGGQGSRLHRELMRQTFRTSLPHLCRYADRDSMAHSVEVRLPFLDPRLAEFALSLPADIVFRDGVKKRVLRDALRGLVPDGIIDRRDKVGYETPERTWFDTPAVRQRFAEVLLDPVAIASGRYNTRTLEQDLKASALRDPTALWRAVNVEMWLRLVVGANPIGVRA